MLEVLLNFNEKQLDIPKKNMPAFIGELFRFLYSKSLSIRGAFWYISEFATPTDVRNSTNARSLLGVGLTIFFRGILRYISEYRPSKNSRTRGRAALESKNHHHSELCYIHSHTALFVQPNL